MPFRITSFEIRIEMVTTYTTVIGSKGGTREYGPFGTLSTAKEVGEEILRKECDEDTDSK